jgi:hypothetical protein
MAGIKVGPRAANQPEMRIRRIKAGKGKKCFGKLRFSDPDGDAFSPVATYSMVSVEEMRLPGRRSGDQA